MYVEVDDLHYIPYTLNKFTHAHGKSCSAKGIADDAYFGPLETDHAQTMVSFFLVVSGTNNTFF